jgi:hypothetical protein
VPLTDISISGSLPLPTIIEMRDSGEQIPL